MSKPEYNDEFNEAVSTALKHAELRPTGGTSCSVTNPSGQGVLQKIERLEDRLSNQDNKIEKQDRKINDLETLVRDLEIKDEKKDVAMAKLRERISETKEKHEITGYQVSDLNHKMAGAQQQLEALSTLARIGRDLRDRWLEVFQLDVLKVSDDDVSPKAVLTKRICISHSQKTHHPKWQHPCTWWGLPGRCSAMARN